MKIRLTLLIILLFTIKSFSANVPSHFKEGKLQIQPTIELSLFTNLSTIKIKEVEKNIGRKLRLKERVAFKLLQWKIKKDIRATKADGKKDNGKTAFILGLIALVGLFIPGLNLASIPLAILAIVKGNKAKRENPLDRKARTAVTLGIITLALLLVIGFTVLVVVAFGGIGPR